jgi:16S rRNA (guanine527-N7)-methyltransferase
VADDLVDICRELGLGLSEAQRLQLLGYLALLQRWNTTFNLTAVRNPADMLVQHLADCLALIPALELRCTEGRLLDVGSGGGLPGIVIAVMVPAVEVTCVDTVGKKAAFVRQAGGALGLANLHVAHAQVQDLRTPPFDVIVSRAFASLADFSRLTLDRLAHDGVWIAMKGKIPCDEMKALPSEVEVFHVEQLQVPRLAADRCLVWMRRPTKP